MSSYDPDETAPPNPDNLLVEDAQIADNSSGGDFLQSPTITPARIGEYIGFEQCPRYFKHSVQGVEDSIHHDGGEYQEAFQPLNILLTKAGEDFEEHVMRDLVVNDEALISLEREPEDFHPDGEVVLDALSTACGDSPGLAEPTVLYQASFAETIGGWRVAGDADLVLIWSTTAGAKVRVLDVKSAQEEKSYHQIQAATYVDLLRTLIEESGNLDEDNIECDAGIITREDTYTPPTPDNVPAFDVEARIMDVRRLLAPDGELLDLARERFEDVPYQIDDKCANCAYNESCLTDAYEDGHLRLLGLSPAQQVTLREEYDINSVSEFAQLAHVPDPDDWYPAQYEDASFQNKKYRKLKSTPGIGEQLPTLLYRARALSDFLDPEGGEIINRHVPWIPGTGRCPLPEDNPPEGTGIEHDWLHGSMVRVYLNVQVDHLRDRLIQLSARINATASETDAQRFSVVSESIPDKAEEAQEAERDLLEQFVQRLYEGIRNTADGIDFSGTDQINPPLHFYLYTGVEETALNDAFARHDTEFVSSFQSLLEGQAGHDRPMVSQLRPSIQTHTAVPTPSPGLLPAYDHLSPISDGYRKPRSNDAWSYTPPYSSSGESVHLRSVFSHRLFDYSVSGEKRDGPGAIIDPTEREFVDGIPTRFRYGAEIPLGYLWSAIGRIDEHWVEEVLSEYGHAEHELARYRYHNPNQRETAIQAADIRALGRHLCDALEHVERALNSRDAALNKEPYPIDKLSEDDFTPPPLGEACRRYLWIEHTAQRKGEYDHYRKFPAQRMLSGKSLPVLITGVEEKNQRTLQAEGRLRFDEQFGNEAENIRRACRQKGSDGTTSGSWMVANSYDFGQIQVQSSQPYEIEAGVQVTLDTLNLDTGEVSFEAHNFYGDTDEFGRHHSKWTTDSRYDTEDSNQTYISPGEQLILDPQTDNITAGRANTALEYADRNELHETLEAVRLGINSEPSTNRIDTSGLSTFADWLSDAYGEDTLPSTEQRRFITEGTAQLVGLQGPPGTGKTAGAFAPALCARLYAAIANDAPFAGLVTAPSNTAIDELLEEVAEVASETNEDFDTSNLSHSLENANLVRIADDKPEDAPDNVTYIDYNDADDDEELEWLRSLLVESETSADEAGSQKQSRLGQYESAEGHDTASQTLVFATPGRAWRLVSKLCPGSEDVDTASQSLWDILAADEASMLTLPQFLLAGAALAPRGQVLVGGDHRQLPPVQKHDWTEESRRDIRAIAPYLSTLDYLRLLRGEDDVMDDERQSDWQHEHNPDSAKTGIPFVRLSRTYRFGQITADLAERTIYSADGIKYVSEREPRPAAVSNDTLSHPLKNVFSDAPITLITYNSDEDFQQWNPIEAEIAAELLAVRHQTTSAGVITPHNAQRARITANLESQNSGTDNAVFEEGPAAVETVNRFQGGERDLMVMSATVSDKQYISLESDFLLSENRVNVSLTRHRDKLVVIAPVDLLGYIPSDPDLYDQTLVWKQLAQSSGEAPTDPSSTAEWSGFLEEFLGDGRDSSYGRDAEISIYELENVEQ